MNLATNGSPRGASVTALILEPFLEGLGGAELLAKVKVFLAAS